MFNAMKKRAARRILRFTSAVLYNLADAWEYHAGNVAVHAAEVMRRGVLHVRFKLSDAACACATASDRINKDNDDRQRRSPHR
jgi:hypothetical protein